MVRIALRENPWLIQTSCQRTSFKIFNQTDEEHLKTPQVIHIESVGLQLESGNQGSPLEADLSISRRPLGSKQQTYSALWMDFEPSSALKLTPILYKVTVVRLCGV